MLKFFYVVVFFLFNSRDLPFGICSNVSMRHEGEGPVQEDGLYKKETLLKTDVTFYQTYYH